MTRVLRMLGLALLAGAASTIGSGRPVPPVGHGQAAHHNAATQAATGFHRGHSMRAMLTMSASVVGADVPAAAALEDGLGRIDFPITAQPLARRYFTQGLGYAYGFNHAAAIASFRKAQRIDPSCAMCWWGEAFAHGPNINAPMDPATNSRAVAVARYANWLARKATPVERAMTGAMVQRYSLDPAADRAALDGRFADAMLAAAARHPAHDDLALIAAEAAMNTKPWDYWAAEDKAPRPRIGEAVGLVESVLARSPQHPQAAHLYIHLMENGPDPKRAEHAADRLNAPLAPASGHLVHMPAHIYFRLGRWQDSIRSNIAAARADEAWIKASGDTGLVRYGYYPHNVHFIVTSAQMAGEMPTAIREARKLGRLLDPAVSAKIAWVQAVNAAPFFAAAQFQSPAEVLAMAPPDARLPYPKAMRLYARALARAQQRNRAGFDHELGQLRKLRQSGAFQSMIDQGVPAIALLQLAETVARARWDYAAGRFDKAADRYREAVAIEATIPYMEPPFWYYPVHQSLAAALFRAGRHAAARDAFATALAQSPNNGWVLYGLARAERSLGNRHQARLAEAALAKAWSGDPRWLKMDRL